MNIFGRKSPKQKLQKKYEKLMEEAFKLSKTNRQASDSKYKEADDIAKQIEAMDD